MEWKGKSLLGLVLLVVGGAVLLEMLGINVGNLIGLLFAILLIVYGAKKLSNANSGGQKMWGASVLIFGILLLIGAAHLFFGIIFAAIVIYIGVRILKNDKGNTYIHEPLTPHSKETAASKQDDFDQEWEKFMKEKL
jgi:lia operon protein LiaI